ncbi:Aldose sugar dehydrogenase YliI [Phycisphaerales bacterium]|nr:Aldose sugar dehydrogenase YliI [Phycisphaerales bacterium]
MRTAVAVTLLLSWTAAGQPPSAPDAPKPGLPAYSPASLSFKVETVVEGVQVPWSIAWTSPERMIFNERPGRVRQVVNGKLSPDPLYTVPNIRAGSEIGLMGLCIHPDYAANKFVYLSFGYQIKDADGTARRDIRVQRFKDDGSTLVADKVLVTVEPAGGNHAGCRIAFGPDGMLYVTTGEAFQRRYAKDMTSLAGKILRLKDDGSVPDDNPFVGEEFKAKGYRSEIWSFGHRNPQGIDWQPGTGLLFETEHGPSGEAGMGGDEFNLVEKGKNYGWPDIHHAQKQEGMESPLIVWDPAVAPASGVFYNSDKFPDLKGNFLTGHLGGLGGEKHPGIVRIVLEGRNVVRQEKFVTDLGRIRCVAVGPDGYVYFSTSNKDGRGQPAPNDDRILRLVPDSK